MVALRQAIGYTNIFDHYDIKQTLGQGKYGEVKAAIHKRTRKRVAVKLLTKEHMQAYEI